MIDRFRPLNFIQPRRIAFGAGVAAQCADDLAGRGLNSAFIITSPPVEGLCGPVCQALAPHVGRVTVWAGIATEPTTADLRAAIAAARDAHADAIFGVGGGSPLDVAKLAAAFIDSPQAPRDAFGINKLAGRNTYLACIPTTAGTGSEVSPNAILLDESEQLKKGVISPHLVPDAALVDPTLTLTVPRPVTAATGIDALTHCIEAYVNRLAHPMIDPVALEGIRLIGRSIRRACEDGSNLEARTDVALGSLFGGMCLGPVNTGAVHALSYPLGGEFHVPHGVANAVLLTHVLRFNLPAAPERYAAVARALGVEGDGDEAAVASAGLARLEALSQSCGIPARLRDVGIPESAIERLARSAMTVTRLLDRNVRTVTFEDAVEIYRKAM